MTTAATNTKCDWPTGRSTGSATARCSYRHDPIDVEGWRGDNFPFTFNIDDDYNVITSAGVLPPTVHLFMQATGVYVCNFLPKPAESVPGTERTPWYHRNVDFDEVAFFHGGSLYGQPMPPGLISHAPRGVHHGAPERARERARRLFDEYDAIEWSSPSTPDSGQRRRRGARYQAPERRNELRPHLPGRLPE